MNGKDMRRMSAFLMVAIFFITGIIICFSPAARQGLKAEVYESAEDSSELLKEKAPVDFRVGESGQLTITVDPAVTYQKIDGFGASLTDCSAYLINGLDVPRRKDIMEKLFDPQRGIGLSFLRQPIGACDFVIKKYSYDDMSAGERDPGLQHFSIDKDRRYIIPLLQQAIALNPRLKIMATPWSPPGWMKTSDSMIGGRLKKSAYGPFANYFVKFVRSYEAAGIPIYAVTPQNEPLFIPDNYPGMGMSAKEEAVLIKKYLGPAFRDAGIKAKIMVFDHNWETLEYPIALLSDSEVSSFVAGTSIHCYGGDVIEQTKLHDLFPKKDVWMTECSYETVPHDENVDASLRAGTQLVIDVMRNWSRTVVLWNLALDPHDHSRLCANGINAGVVKIDTAANPSSITMTADYYALGHVSKFVPPGAIRIASNTFKSEGLDDVAFRNQDGSVVLLALNSGKAEITFDVRYLGRYFTYTLPAGAAVTFRWKPQP